LDLPVLASSIDFVRNNRKVFTPLNPQFAADTSDLFERALSRVFARHLGFFEKKIKQKSPSVRGKVKRLPFAWQNVDHSKGVGLMKNETKNCFIPSANRKRITLPILKRAVSKDWLSARPAVYPLFIFPKVHDLYPFLFLFSTALIFCSISAQFVSLSNNENRFSGKKPKQVP
jgi:hypothetical protein